MTYENRSPWLHHLKRRRPVKKLEEDVTADIGIVGGGIAGASTAYFILRDTDSSVDLFEAGLVAHGATGHNAGQAVSYFERPFHDIVREFGLTMAAQGYEDVRSAWHLLDVIYRDLDLKTPLARFPGYAGCIGLPQIIEHLENNFYKVEAGLAPENVIVAEEALYPGAIPEKYSGLYQTLPHKKVLELLETRDERYIAALGSLKGCMNSAAFTEEVIERLLARYPRRFRVFENTPIHTARLRGDHALLLTADRHLARVGRVVLCTNGFEYIKIANEAGGDIDTEFHHMLKGSVGYMAAYTHPSSKDHAAISYLSDGTSGSAFDADPYFYVTRRKFGYADGNMSLTCIGGPEILLEDTTLYSRKHPYPAEAEQVIASFLSSSYGGDQPDAEARHYRWHGLMGYTPNGIRRVAAEPKNPVLLYNLGCNGVGILPSIFGGQRISWILEGRELAPSIFDIPPELDLVSSETGQVHSLHKDEHAVEA